MNLASVLGFGVGPLEWKIIPRIHLGPLAISPHGIGIAVGFLIGAQYMVRRSKRFGGPDENDIWNALFWALIGSMVGARFAYCIGHFSEVTKNGDDLLGIFKVWQGGISLLGGITGAVLAAFPYVRKHRMGFWTMTDLAAPGLALGIFVGRIGDLMIGDHLGKPTNFFLGWRCLGESGGVPPQPESVYRAALEQGNAPSLGCYDITLHQTAIYDFILAGILFGVLVWIGRKVRNRGFLTLIFGFWYGGTRVLEDFLRVDKRYLGLTGSQITALIVMSICVYLMLRYRGAPPRYAEPAPGQGGPEPPGTIASTTEGDEIGAGDAVPGVEDHTTQS